MIVSTIKLHFKQKIYQIEIQKYFYFIKLSTWWQFLKYAVKKQNPKLLNYFEV